MKLIVAFDKFNGIGRLGTLPWYFQTDMAHFVRSTSGGVLIMGRRTWESIGRPLRNRHIVVVSKTVTKNWLPTNVSVETNLEDAITKYKSSKLYIAGGAEIYNQTIGRCSELIVTKIDKDFDCDVKCPPIPSYFVKDERHSEVHYENFTRLEMARYIRRPQEQIYLNKLAEILSTGVERTDRTNVGTISKFGVQMRFDISNEFPLLTTKKMSLKTIAEELFWFISGSTNANILQQKGIKIWIGNTSREFLDAAGFTDRAAGDLGPGYGFQWRHWGAEYTNCDAKYEGIDQLKNVIADIRANPTSRRIIMTAWNPRDVPNTTLPPCHVLLQFYVDGGRLSAQLYQRSGDMALGVPFNIASYSLLVYIIAKMCDLVPGEFVHTIGDAHIYKTHVAGVKEQLARAPDEFPKMNILRKYDDVGRYGMADLELTEYLPSRPIRMDMAI